MELTQRRPARTKAGGLPSSRQGTIAIALVAALLAAGILVFALHRYRQSIETADKPSTVLIANQFIAKGTAGAAIGVGHYFRPAKLLDRQVVSGALASSAALHGEVAAVDIYAGQQLTAADFTSGGLFYSKLPRNQVAVSLPVDTSHGLIGDIETGDRVDAYVSFPREQNRVPYLRLVAANVVVLDAGKAPPAGTLGVSASSTTSNVVLEVGAHRAAELAFAGDNGKVWLVLRQANGTAPGSEIVSEASILAENPAPSRKGEE